ncbi:MAG: lysophospholipid acyltransferase family protein [Pseudomonadota bacterium]
MSVTWKSEDPPPDPVRPRGFVWFLIILRGLGIAAVFGIGYLALLLLLGLERITGRRRGLGSLWMPVFVSRVTLRCMGLPRTVSGDLSDAKLLVANHASWLDILVLNALGPMAFVAKDDVEGWPGIGPIAKHTGTLFISRNPRASKDQAARLSARLSFGERLLLFPEGTSTDGRRVHPFRSSMFGGIDWDTPLEVQPISVVYHAPPGADPRFYGWWGDMDLGPSLLQVLATRPQGNVTVTLHEVVSLRDFANRKELVRRLEATVRMGLEKDLQS